MAIGRAPVQATLRAASATAMRPPTRGSRYTYRPLQSVLTAIALLVPRTRRTAASPPGPTTVLVRTVESYWRNAQVLLASVGAASSFSRVQEWSLSSGREGTASGSLFRRAAITVDSRAS